MAVQCIQHAVPALDVDRAGRDSGAPSSPPSCEESLQRLLQQRARPAILDLLQSDQTLPDCAAGATTQPRRSPGISFFENVLT